MTNELLNFTPPPRHCERSEAIDLGVLDELFKNVASHMNERGIYGFSTQKIGDGHKDWILGDDHRYAHSKSYIERCAGNAGLKILSCDDVDLRLDAGAFITGSVFVCGKS